MKRTSSRKVRLAYQLICYKNGKEVGRYQKRMKNAIIDLIKHVSADKWYLRVGYQPTVYNDGDFDNQEDLLNAMTEWTSKDLLDYVEEGRW